MNWTCLHVTKLSLSVAFLKCFSWGGWISTLIPSSQLSQCEPCKAEKQKGPNWFNILGPFSRTVVWVYVQKESRALLLHLAVQYLAACAAWYKHCFLQMTAVIKRDQQNVGEAHSSGFLVLGKTCKDEPYLCKLTIHPSAFIAWTNLCLPLQELKPSEPRVCVCCFAAGLARGNPADPAPFHLAAAPRGCFAQLCSAGGRDPRDHRQQPAVGWLEVGIAGAPAPCQVGIRPSLCPECLPSPQGLGAAHGSCSVVMGFGSLVFSLL